MAEVRGCGLWDDAMNGRSAMSRICRACALGIALLFSEATASAQGVQEFFANKTMTLIVSSDVGGGYDAYSRLLARHITRHIPGRPGIVVQNMPGASSLNAINYIANVAPRDGLVLSDTDSTMPFYTLFEGGNARFDPRRLNWLGSISKQIGVCAAWHEGPIKTIDDVMARPMRLAATAAAGWRFIMPRLYNLTAGSKFEVITGYKAAQVFMAIERREVEGACVTHDTLLAVKSDWLRDGKLTFLLQFGNQSIAGLEQVPLALDRVRDADDRAALELILSQQITGRPYVVPPGVLPERLAALRAAFEATMVDPDYLSDARKMRLMIDPLTAKQFDALLDRAYAAPAETIDRAKSLLARASRR
jgi:tripartite-type tricarboxylate transporter receptor subunit TctC